MKEYNFSVDFRQRFSTDVSVRQTVVLSGIVIFDQLLSLGAIRKCLWPPDFKHIALFFPLDIRHHISLVLPLSITRAAQALRLGFLLENKNSWKFQLFLFSNQLVLEVVGAEAIWQNHRDVAGAIDTSHEVVVRCVWLKI